MTDVLNKEQRSYNMSMIRSINTKPEISLRKTLFNSGIRCYRVHYKLPGKPDIVFPKYKVAVFVDGCFWHKCPKCFVKPKTRTKFWVNKIDGNVRRDKEINKKLKSQGWKVIRLFEHQLNKKHLNISYSLIERELRKRGYMDGSFKGT